MARNEGILFSDIFVSDKDLFVDFFEQYYTQNQAEMDPVIAKLYETMTSFESSVVTIKTADAFKKAWEDFERIVLLRGEDLELIVAYRGNAGLNGTFSQIVKQADVEGIAEGERGRRYGIQTGHDLIKDTMKALEASEVEKFLQTHLNDFLNQLETRIDTDEAFLLHKYHTDCLANYFQENHDAHLTGAKFREAFYTQSAKYYFGGAGLGVAYDAYMNHMANKETWVNEYLKMGGMISAPEGSPFVNQAKNSVYVEEGEVQQGATFPRLLRDSKNNTPWYTGGDVVIINPQTMQVVYNIQLKTTTLKSLTVFPERVDKIRKFIKQFYQDKTPREKAARLFDFLLMSVSNADDFNSIPDQEVNNLLKGKLWELIT